MTYKNRFEHNDDISTQMNILNFPNLHKFRVSNFVNKSLNKLIDYTNKFFFL